MDDDDDYDVEFIIEEVDDDALEYFIMYTNGDYLIGTDHVWASSLEDAHDKAQEGFAEFPEANHFYVDVLH